MTREELINELKNRIGFETDNESYAMSKSEREFYTDILKALEQEPCELLILKSSLLSHQDDLKRWSDSIKKGKEEGLIILPPYLEPMLVPNDIEIKIEQEKTGHWECNELFYNGENRGAIIRCSKCGNEFKVSPKVFENLYDNERFCNHCGAKMEG